MDNAEKLPAQTTENQGSRIFQFFREAQQLSRVTVHGALENDEPNNGQTDDGSTTTIPHRVFRKSAL